jgi:hypothetical protein
MFIFGILVVIQNIAEKAAVGRTEAGIHIAATALTNVGLFAVLVSSALINIRRPEWHKRLMLMAAISILGAPIARWFIVYLHMMPPTPIADWIVVLLATVPLLHDWQTRGRPHTGYSVAFGAMVAVRLVREPMANTHLWHAFTAWLLNLAG